jgi:hypothetical protein
MHDEITDNNPHLELLRQVASLVRLPADADLSKDLIPTVRQALEQPPSEQGMPVMLWR